MSDTKDEGEALIERLTSDDELIMVNSEIPVSKILTKIIRQGIPMALSYTFPASMVVTAIMITHLKEESQENYLATATLVTTMTHIIACVSFSPFLAMITLGSEKYGELRRFLTENNETQIVHTRKNTADLFKTSIALSTFILPIPFLAMFFSEFILVNIFAQNKHISGLVQQNLRAYSYAIPGLMYRICMEQILFSFKKSHHTMLMGLCTFALGTASAYYLAFGSPNLGLAGIAYGFVIESYLTALIFAAYLHWHPSLKDIPFLTFTNLCLNSFISHQAKELLKMGLPITVQMSCELSAALLMSFFAGWLSENSLAAQNFSVQLFTFALIPSDAFAQTLVQAANQLIGENDFHNASRFAKYGLLANIGLISLVCIPVSISPSILTSMFGSSVNPNVMKMAKYLVPLAAGQTLAETAGLSMTQTLRAANDLYKPTMIKVICLWLGVLTAYLLGFKSSLSIYGVNIGFLFGVTLGTAILAPRWMARMTANNLERTKISNTSSTFFYQIPEDSYVENRLNSELKIPEHATQSTNANVLDR